MTINRAALVASLMTLVATLATIAVPALPYTRGFAPDWVTVVATLLGALFTVLARPIAIGWIAALGLLWSASGLVLDCFRAFFWVTGIPAGDFSQVDWAGMLVRALSLAATALVGALLLRRTRAPGGVWLGYTAFGLAFVYPVAKLYWWLGGEILRPTGFDQGLPVGELAAMAIGAVGSLALVQSWGRRLPRRLVLVGGWTGAAALTTMGSLAAFGVLADLLGVTDGPIDLVDTAGLVMVGLIYGSWLLFGLAVGGATLAYQQATAPKVRHGV